MKIKVSEATSIQLNWLVAKCKGENDWEKAHDSGAWAPTADPAQGHPILEQEKIAFSPEGRVWLAVATKSEHECFQFGPTMLIAGLRCYVASKLGDEVEIPEDLL